MLPDLRKQLRHHCCFATLLSNQGRPLICFSDRTVASGGAVIAAAEVYLGSMSCSIQLSSAVAFLSVEVCHKAAPLAFIVVCVLFFLNLSLSDVGMLRFQTSEALWDRSSVSAGSVTLRLYRLQCLVGV